VALLSSRALEYNSRHRTVEKRLIRYLSWRWRCAAAGGDLVQRSRIETLLTEAGLKILVREPARTRERLESALDRLAEDGVIAAWQYGESWLEANLPRRGWLQQWRHAVAIIEAPDSIKDAYRALGKTEQIPRANSRDNVGYKVRERRKHQGLSQLVLAEKLKISQATLSRAENGQPCSKKIERLLTGWLEHEGEIIQNVGVSGGERRG
jgi:DNA-binding XRE family transcriptional regulator